MRTRRDFLKLSALGAAALPVSSAVVGWKYTSQQAIGNFNMEFWS